MRRYIIIFLISFPSLHFGQHSNSFSVIGGQLSLSNPSYDIVQDHYGLMWAGTSGGLLKYDGYNITHYKHNFQDTKSLPANTIQKLFVDSRGRLWISIQNFGLCYFDRDRDQFFRIPGKPGYKGSLQSTTVYAFEEDTDGNIWIGGNAGLEKLIFFDIRLDSISWYHYKHSEEDNTSMLNGDVFNLLFDSKENLWVSSQSGICRKERNSDTFYHYLTNDKFPEGSFQFAIEDNNGMIWLGGSGKNLQYYNYKQDLFSSVPEVQFGPGELYATFDNVNTLLISQTGNSFLKYNVVTGQSLFYNTQKENDLNIYGSFIRSSYIDNQNNLWIAGGAAFQINPANNKEIDHLAFEYEGKNNVSAILDDGKYLWIGQLFGGFIKIEKSTGNTKRFTECLSQNCLINNRIYHLSTLKDGKLLIAGRGGLLTLDKNTDVIKRIYEFSNLLRWAHEDLKGNIWLGVEGVGLSYLTPTEKERITVLDGKNGPKITLIRQIIENENGSFWLASSGEGLILYHPETGDFKQFLPQSGNMHSLIGSRVECLMKDQKERLWVGTREGLSCLNLTDLSFKNFTTNQGLSNDIISSIVEGEDGNIWVATNNGINKINGNTYEVVTYDMNDGFLNESFYYRASFKNEEGLIYFGGINGIDAFDPREISVNPIPPKVILTGFFVLGEEYSLGKAFESIERITLDHDDNLFTFSLSALHFVAPTKNRYTYKMDGFNDEWVDIGTARTVTFTNLDPGTYIFRARASNSDGVWSENTLNIIIEITPPFWKTWWFKLMSFLFIGGLLYAIYRYRISIIRQQESLKTAFEKQVAELEMKALRSQMNPHFLFNSLNSVKSLISHNQNQKASEYLTQFSKLIRKVLNNSRSKMVRLIDDIEALELYMKLEKMRFSGRFDYSINIAEGVNPDFIEVPPLLLQPFVENAVWHGIMHKENGGGQIDVNIFREGDYVIMEVDDNGIGREMAAAIKTKSRSKKESLGIDLTSERLTFLSNLLGGKSKIEIIDKYDDRGTGVGTMVKIILYIPD